MSTTRGGGGGHREEALVVGGVDGDAGRWALPPALHAEDPVSEAEQRLRMEGAGMGLWGRNAGKGGGGTICSGQGVHQPFLGVFSSKSTTAV